MTALTGPTVRKEINAAFVELKCPHLSEHAPGDPGSEPGVWPMEEPSICSPRRKSRKPISSGHKWERLQMWAGFTFLNRRCKNGSRLTNAQRLFHNSVLSYLSRNNRHLQLRSHRLCCNVGLYALLRVLLVHQLWIPHDALGSSRFAPKRQPAVRVYLDWKISRMVLWQIDKKNYKPSSFIQFS